MTTNAQHTPGPWQSRDDMTTEGFVTIIANVDGEILDGSPSYTFDTVCICEDEYGDRLLNVAANVRLIAAAPDLLEALRTARIALMAIADSAAEAGFGTLAGIIDEQLIKANSAIALATGEPK